MSESSPRASAPSQQLAELALRVTDHIPAMLAYWNSDQVCLFANQAYLAWFALSLDTSVHAL